MKKLNLLAAIVFSFLLTNTCAQAWGFIKFYVEPPAAITKAELSNIGMSVKNFITIDPNKGAFSLEAAKNAITRYGWLEVNVFPTDSRSIPCEGSFIDDVEKHYVVYIHIEKNDGKPSCTIKVEE